MLTFNDFQMKIDSIFQSYAVKQSLEIITSATIFYNHNKVCQKFQFQGLVKEIEDFECKKMHEEQHIIALTTCFQISIYFSCFAKRKRCH